MSVLSPGSHAPAHVASRLRAPTLLSEAAQAAIRGLRATLLREGYVDSYHVWGTLHLRLGKVRELLDALPGPTRTLVRLFLLGDEISHVEIGEVLSTGELDVLCQSGFLLAGDAGLHTGGLLLLPLCGLLMVLPSSAIRAAAELGDESLILAARFGPSRGLRCADLGPGSGSQALRAALAGGRPVFVAGDVEAAGCMAWSAALNGVSAQIDLRQGDLEHGLLGHEQFDLITATLPLPTPALSPQTLGADGVEVRLRRLVLRLPALLSPHGTARIIAGCSADRIGEPFREELLDTVRAQGAQAICTVVSQGPRRVAQRLDAPAHAASTLLLTITRGARHPGVQSSVLRSDAFYGLAVQALREMPAIAEVCARHQLALPAPDDFHKVGLATLFTSGSHVVKLLAPHLASQLHREAAALRIVQDQIGVATPQVVAHGVAAGWPYLLLTQVVGCPLAAIAPQLDRAQRQQIGAQVGRILRQLHAVSIGDARGLESDMATDWPGFLAARRAACVAQHKRQGTRAAWLARIPEMLAAAEPLVPADFQPLLLHTDANEDNVFVAPRPGGWEVVGLVDFGDARLGSWEYDLVVPAIHLARGDRSVLDAILVGYGVADRAAVQTKLLALAWLHEAVDVALASCPAPSGPDPQLADVLWPVH